VGGFLDQYWPVVLSAVVTVSALVASGHAVIYKRDPRAAVLWVGLIWLVPVVGPLLYLLFGINRIRRRAAMLLSDRERIRATSHAHIGTAEDVTHALAPVGAAHLGDLVGYMNRSVGRPLVSGNTAEVLVDGDEAFPAMLEAIGRARRTVTMCTYIFDRDRAGRMFVEALAAAHRRGVQVRVLIDWMGSRYSWPTIVHDLRAAGVPHARFMAPFRHGQLGSLNLRNHRKVLVVDGAEGFTGGMNIREGCLVRTHPPRPVHDLQFRLAGPVVAHLQEAFADDWLFTTGEALRGDDWFPVLEPVPGGTLLARGIPDGPDEDFDKLRWALIGALAVARRRVLIATPYFLPETALIAALGAAALRGVEVDIVLPAANNLPFMHWAATAQLWQVLEHGCRVWLTQSAFDHSKLMVVDGGWAFIGSANWDARSLRLNFEFNVELYDATLAAELEAWAESRFAQAHRVTLAEVDARPLWQKLRDGTTRLLAPYL
jgi:cardiolipin synthase